MRHTGEDSPGNTKGVGMKTMTTVERNEQDEHRALPKPDTLLAAPLILIAEEHPAIQELLNTALALAGYRTTICTGRHAALTWIDQLTSSGDCPALLLLDLSLPSIHAADFLSHLRTRWLDVCGGHPQIIVLTTSKQVQKDLAAQERVVLKPFHIQELLTLIQQMPFNHLQRITAPSQNKAIGDATKAVQGYERFVDNQASTRDQ
jgi:CheY-like chemotaxis protein